MQRCRHCGCKRDEHKGDATEQCPSVRSWGRPKPWIKFTTHTDAEIDAFLVKYWATETTFREVI